MATELPTAANATRVGRHDVGIGESQRDGSCDSFRVIFPPQYEKRTGLRLHGARVRQILFYFAGLLPTIVVLFVSLIIARNVPPPPLVSEPVT